ncbi:MAG: hypothetical protein HFH88_18065 [Lachnospiraceae bacterium]|nr:hypothetical protein [Lachnospiraceae bacterium]
MTKENSSILSDYLKSRHRVGTKVNTTVQSIAIADGAAAVLDANGKVISCSNSILNNDKIVIPGRYVDLSRIRGIFVNSGIIRFDENKALLNFAIQESSERTIMPQLGKVGEAAIVKRCSESEEINYEMFCIAAGKKAHRRTAEQFEAIGTGLIDTRTSHNRHYNPMDTQRDIIFVNKDDIPALMSNATSLAGQCAGLQVKTSNEIISYILRDVVTVRYCVPIICLPVMDFSGTVWLSKDLNNKERILTVNIYDELIYRIKRNKNYVNKLIENNQDYFSDHLSTIDRFESRLYEYLKRKVYDIRDIDRIVFDEVMFMKDLLEQLVYGRISPDDLMCESEILKSYFMSIGLMIAAPNVENNNMYVSKYNTNLMPAFG